MRKRQDMMAVERLSLLVFAVALITVVAAMAVRSCNESYGIPAPPPVADSTAIATDTAAAPADTIKKKKRRGKRKKEKSPPQKPRQRHYHDERVDR